MTADDARLYAGIVAAIVIAFAGVVAYIVTATSTATSKAISALTKEALATNDLSVKQTFATAEAGRIELKKQINFNDDEMVRLRTRVGVIDLDNQALRASLAQTQRFVVDRDATIDMLSRARKENEREIAELTRQVTLQTKKISDLELAQQNKDSQIVDLTQQIFDLKQQLTDASKLIKEQSAQLAEMSATIKQLAAAKTTPKGAPAPETQSAMVSAESSADAPATPSPSIALGGVMQMTGVLTPNLPPETKE